MLRKIVTIVVLTQAIAVWPMWADEDGSLSVRVTDERGQPVSAEVQLVDELEVVDADRSTETDGIVVFSKLPQPPVRLVISAPGYRTVDRELVDFEAKDLTVVLDALVVEGSLLVTASAPELVAGDTIAGSDLETSGSADVGRFLRGETGIGAARRGPVNLDPTVRGLQETQVAVFVDGTRTFAAGPGRMDSGLSHVGPDSVDSIEVVKGPYALTWGAGALSAIRVITRAPDYRTAGFDWQGQAFAHYGENSSTRGSLKVGGASDRFRFQLVHGVREGDDYEAGDGTLVPADYRSEDSRWHLGWQLGPSVGLEYSGGYQEQRDIDYPGRLLDATYFYTRSHNLEGNWNPSSQLFRGLRAQVYSNRKDHRMNNDEKPTAQPMSGRVPPFGLDIDLPAESDTVGAKLEVELAPGATSLKLGLDTFQLDQSAQRSISRRDTGVEIFHDIVWPDAELRDVGLYAHVRRQLGSVDLASTVRVDRVRVRAGGVSDFFAQQVGTDLDTDETNVGASVSARVRLGPSWSLNLGLGRAVRTASILERFSDRFPSTKFQVAAEFLGNPDLDPEVSHQVDLGLLGSLGNRGDLSTVGAVEILLDAYYRVIDDYVTVVADPTIPRRLPLSPPTVYRYRNGSEATFYGGELQLRQDLGRHLAWRAEYSWTRAVDEIFDEPVLGIAPPSGGVGLRATVGRSHRGWGDLGLRVVADQDRVALARLERSTPGYETVDLRLGYEHPRGWSVTVGVENLLDAEYADHQNSLNPFLGQRILEPGRNVYGGVRVPF